MNKQVWTGDAHNLAVHRTAKTLRFPLPVTANVRQ